MSQHTATYSPDDNKLRLYPAYRLNAEEYARIKAAGFSWAPKQELFVAPMWTPAREDLLLEWCGDIGDEDTSLVERAEVRADRFEDYSERRAADGSSALRTVDAIAERFPDGQPILVGHHSEKRARKDAERIQTGMRRALRLFETSTYWESRAAGALRHAKYKELPGVRQRRIKGIESDLRKSEREIERATGSAKRWQAEGLTRADAIKIAGDGWGIRVAPGAHGNATDRERSLYDMLERDEITPTDAAAVACKAYGRTVEHYTRWAEHYRNRLAYERAMLGEQGGGGADRWPDMQPGGQVQARRGWCVILRVNRKDGGIVSVTTTARYVRVVDISEVTDYKPPAADDAERVAAAMKLPPICNYQGEGFHAMTQAEWDRTPKDYKGTKVLKEPARHRVRQCSAAFIKPRPPGAAGYVMFPVFISDAKLKPAPESDAAPAPAPLPRPDFVTPAPRVEPAPPSEAEQATAALRASLRAGVQVVAAPQLFPTPARLAAKVARLADVQPGMQFLEPSAGTGNLVDAVLNLQPGAVPFLVEQDHRLAERLDAKYKPGAGRCAGLLRGDFLAAVEKCDLGTYDRIVMNPPFANAADIAHIQAAARLLNPGGRLVAICANGPRQQAALKPIAAHWEDLPAGSFEQSGTMVNVALLVIERPAERAPTAAGAPARPFRAQTDLFAA